MNVSAFKAYDIRGRIPDELNPDIAKAIGYAFATYLKPGKVVIGHDIRLSSPEMAAAVISGLRLAGTNVTDIGMCGTEEVYFATDHYNFDGGIMVTASHNPKDYNGMKLVRENAKPVSGDTGLNDIKSLVHQFVDTQDVESRTSGYGETGILDTLDHRNDYLEHLLSFLDIGTLKPLKIVANPGNGGAGLVMKALAERLPIDLIEVFFEPDGDFPNGVPNPLLEENRGATQEAIRRHNADFGIAWDGDFDRCFLFDEKGRFIEGYYIVGLLAQAFLQKLPGSVVIHDPRLTWNTLEIVEAGGGRAVMSKTGHAFIKERMRKEDAVYGGEMSAHHYFRDFAYCDSGMLPWLLVMELMSREDSRTPRKLSELVDDRIEKFPCSGEINRRIEDPGGLLAKLQSLYESDALAINHVDGLSMEFEDWRFNIRSSNTEPVVRLNVESRGDSELMSIKRDELLSLLGGSPA